jgi:hypothetical protein
MPQELSSRFFGFRTGSDEHDGAIKCPCCVLTSTYGVAQMLNVSAGLKRSHSRRYGMHHLTPEVTSAHTPTKAANRRSKSQECEFFPAETNHQFTGILPRRPFPQELRTLGVFVIRPGRLDDQVPRTRIVTLPTRRNMAWHRFEGQFAMSCSA